MSRNSDCVLAPATLGYLALVDLLDELSQVWGSSQGGEKDVRKRIRGWFTAAAKELATHDQRNMRANVFARLKAKGEVQAIDEDERNLVEKLGNALQKESRRQTTSVIQPTDTLTVDYIAAGLVAFAEAVEIICRQQQHSSSDTQVINDQGIESLFFDHW